MTVCNVADTEVAVHCALEIAEIINNGVTDIAEIIVCHATDISVMCL